MRAPTFRLMLLVVTAVGMEAHAHSRLDSPTPRTQRDDYKDFNGGLNSCLTDPTTVPPTAVVEGQSLNVHWTETINHPGCFLLSVRAGPNGAWMDLANVKHAAIGPTPRPWSTTVRLPAGAVGAGSVLLLRQVMLADETVPCPPNPIPTNVTYYSCADLVIERPDAGHPEPDAGVGPRPDGGAMADAGSTPDADAGTVPGGAPGLPSEDAGPAAGPGAGSPSAIPAGKVTGGCGSGGIASLLGVVLAAAFGQRRRSSR